MTRSWEDEHKAQRERLVYERRKRAAAYGYVAGQTRACASARRGAAGDD